MFVIMWNPQPCSAALDNKTQINPKPPGVWYMLCRLHSEPVTDILFTEEAIFTACSSGCIRCWLRPHVAEEMVAQLQQQQGSMPPG